MTPQEKAVVATVATSCLLSFLIPQSHFQGFLHSYYAASPELKSSSHTTGTTALSSLEERLMNATLSNHNNTSGGVFPYSASRMRSLVVDDDPFTTPAFHRFLVQGLRSYLSSGMAFNWLSKEEIIANEDMDDDDDGEQGISCDKVHFQAGVDLIQLLAMAICPNPPSEKNDAFMTASEPTATVPLNAKKGGDRESEGSALKSVSQLANSSVPFSFQLSYLDRLQLVRLCMMALPLRG